MARVVSLTDIQPLGIRIYLLPDGTINVALDYARIDATGAAYGQATYIHVPNAQQGQTLKSYVQNVLLPAARAQEGIS